MVSESEFSRIENRMKLSLLQAEKRLVELEVSVTELKELKEKLKNVDFSSVELLQSLPDMKKQVDDLQDMTMVENLGVEELKKLMEELKSELQNQQAPNVNEAIKGIQPQIGAIEEKIRSLQSDIVSMKADTVKNAELSALKENIENFVSEKVNTEMKLSELQKKMDVAIQSISNGLSKVDAEVQKVEWLRVNTDLNNFEGNLETVRQAEANVTQMVAKVEALYDTVSKKMEAMHSSVDRMSSVPQRVSFLELELHKMKDLNLLPDKVLHLENQLEPLKNLQGKISNVEMQLESVKSQPDVSNKISGLETELNLMKLEVRSKPNPKTTSPNELDELRRKIDENRLLLQDRVRKEEILKLLDDTNRRIGNVERKFSTDISKKEMDFHTILKQDFEPVFSAVSTQISSLLDRLVAIESKIAMLEKNQSMIQPIILE